MTQRFFVQPIAQAEDDYEDVFDDGDRVARYIMRQRYGQVDLGMNFGTVAQLRLGVRSGSKGAELDTGAPALPEFARTPDTTVELRALFDTRDTLALPTRGTLVNVHYAHSESWFGGQFDYSLFEGLVARAFSVHDGDSLTLLAGGGYAPSGELPSTELFKLGGIRTFPGLRPGELRGTSYWSAGTRYAWRLADIQPLFGQALYAESGCKPRRCAAESTACRPTRSTASRGRSGAARRLGLFSILDRLGERRQLAAAVQHRPPGVRGLAVRRLAVSRWRPGCSGAPAPRSSTALLR